MATKTIISRRQFLKTGLMAGAGFLVSGRSRIVQASTQDVGRRTAVPAAQAAALPAIIDPLYVAPILDPAAVPQFVKPLPVIKALGLRKDLTAGGAITVNMKPVPGGQDILGLGVNTPVWGYEFDGTTTYPGATIVARSGVPVTVRWRNQLGTQHLLPVDTTLHWAFGKAGGSIGADGVPAVAHLHGGHTDSAYDGLPEQWFTPSGKNGSTYVTNDYAYDNSQEAATLWYHDHALGITRLNVYAGLAGFYLLRDDNEQSLIDGSAIPSGDYEIELVVQDRMFYPDGRLAYPDAPWVAPGGMSVAPSVQPEFFGQVILVNGKAWPRLDVDRAQYRLRLLNGSDSRFYDLWITDPVSGFSPTMYVIGNDVGLLNSPVRVNRLTIGPGERYDLVVDFTGAPVGATLIMRNNARSPFPKGATANPNLDGQIMAFVVGNGTGPAPLTQATNLRPVLGPIPAPAAPAVTRKLMLFEATDHYGRLQPLLGVIGGANDGTLLWDDVITETPALNSTEVWEIYNATMDAHPIHLHLVAFQILGRQKYTASILPKTNVDPLGHAGDTLGGILQNIKLKGKAKGPAAYEAGWKDTTIMYPGEVTRVIAKFDKPGRYVWHCHILSHEDHEMMRPYHVAPLP